MDGPYITVTSAPGRHVVRARGAILGESPRALELREGDQTPVIYFPPEDIAVEFLDDSDFRSNSLRLGVARHFSIVTNDGVLHNAAWCHEAPGNEAQAIAGYLAFDPEQVTVEPL